MAKRISAAILVILMLIMTACGANSDKRIQAEEEAILTQARRIQEVRDFIYEFIELGRYDNPLLEQNENPYPEVDSYHEVSGYNSIAELKEYVLGFYSEAVAQESYFGFFEDEERWKVNGGPYLVEVDGKLYADNSRFGGGDNCIYDAESIKVLDINEDFTWAEISVEYYFSLEPENIRTVEIPMVKQNGVWVFDQYI